MIISEHTTRQILNDLPTVTEGIGVELTLGLLRAGYKVSARTRHGTAVLSYRGREYDLSIAGKQGTALLRQ